MLQPERFGGRSPSPLRLPLRCRPRLRPRRHAPSGRSSPEIQRGAGTPPQRIDDHASEAFGGEGIGGKGAVQGRFDGGAGVRAGNPLNQARTPCPPPLVLTCGRLDDQVQDLQGELEERSRELRGVMQARLRLEQKASEAEARAGAAEDAVAMVRDEMESLRHRTEALVSQQQADLLQASPVMLPPPLFLPSSSTRILKLPCRRRQPSDPSQAKRRTRLKSGGTRRPTT